MSKLRYTPVVSSDSDMAEFTFRALILGIFMCVILGAANAYLGLKAGMTIAATYPAAVIGMAVGEDQARDARRVDVCFDQGGRQISGAIKPPARLDDHAVGSRVHKQRVHLHLDAARIKVILFQRCGAFGGGRRGHHHIWQ